MKFIHIYHTQITAAAYHQLESMTSAQGDIIATATVNDVITAIARNTPVKILHNLEVAGDQLLTDDFGLCQTCCEPPTHCDEMPTFYLPFCYNYNRIQEHEPFKRIYFAIDFDHPTAAIVIFLAEHLAINYVDRLNRSNFANSPEGQRAHREARNLMAYMASGGLRYMI